MKALALIMGAGRGARLGGKIPKQYQTIGDKAVIRHTIEAFLDHSLITGVHVVINREDQELYKQATSGLDLPKPIYGGTTRQESVLLGLEGIEKENTDIVLIHDAVRPFVTGRIITDSIEGLMDSDSVIAALPVNDTIKHGTKNKIDKTIERKNLWLAQTPQTFRYDQIISAHKDNINNMVTDDAAIAESSGLSVSVIRGSQDNIKITTEEDLAKAKQFLNKENMNLHVGLGFDVHKFTKGDAVTICGVKIPHTHQLEGHSDADVGLHAITDAILGALGEGDIGTHFPPNDIRWKDADSKVFLSFAIDKLKTKKASINNLDLTIICESPKIIPHRETMTEKISVVTELSSEKINIKATTTERLGFLGRSEGIAVQALATIRLPL